MDRDGQDMSSGPSDHSDCLLLPGGSQAERNLLLGHSALILGGGMIRLAFALLVPSWALP